MLFLAGAVVLGGGGSPNPGTELALQVAFVAAALAWLWVPPRRGPLPVPADRAAWLVGGLVLALPLIQLVPLPHDVWAHLPGQADRAAALALVEREHSWQPLARSPTRTLAALLAIIPALFAFFAAAALPVRDRLWLIGAISVMAAATALLGGLQVSLGAEAPYLYSQNHRNLTGFQANRNAAADVLLIGIAATAAFFAPSTSQGAEGRWAGAAGFDRRAAGIALASLLVLLSFAIILTSSRTGIAMLPFALAGAWLAIRASVADSGRWRHLSAVAAGGAVMLVVGCALFAGNAVLADVAERFAVTDDPRRELWRDGWFAVSQAWPAGVGLGAAQPALIAAERLEVLDAAVPNRVHNDYLELALEGGLPALVLLAAIGLILAQCGWRAWRERPAERSLTAFGSTAVLVCAAHSLVDYPLRSMALSCLVGAGAGMLMTLPRRQPASESADNELAA